MKKQKYLIGIDNGGTMSKAALYDLNGKELAVSSVKTEMLLPHPGFTERNMDEMWQANVKAIREVIELSGINPKDIASIATTGHGNGMYLVGYDGRPVYNGIISTDTRAKEYVANWYKDGTFEKLLPKTMQSIWAGQPVALLAWFKENKPDVLKNTKHIFMCKDYIRYKLTGEAYAEITDMSGTNLMNVRDVKYDEEILKEYGIEEVLDKLPPIKYSDEICGYVSKKAAEEIGIEEGIPVAGGLFDIDSCAIATGITDEEKLCIIAGTWSINEYISKKPVVSKDLFMTSLYCMKGYWLTTEASATSSSNLEWFATYLLDGDTNQCKASGKSVYEYVNELVSTVGPEEAEIVFLPFLYGTNVDADAKACFIGINGWHKKAHIMRALYEGVVFCHKAHIDKLLLHRSIPSAIRIAGGAAKSKIWVQIFADVLQIPIEVTSSTELGTLGAAICAGVATQNFQSYDSAVAAMVKVEYVCYPDPNKKELYERKYCNYNTTVTALSSVWKKLK
jgi:L-xylulokinase